MPRSIWSGAISFGLVNVPIRVVTAVHKKDVRFHQLHANDGARIQQKRMCSQDGHEVPWDEIVKGYELGGGQYVIIEPDELDSLDPETTHTIDIEDFVHLDQIDPLFFDSSYYLVPDDRGEKPYRLLLEAMQESGKVGIARVVMRTKQYLCAVRPLGDALVLTTMNFADEVVPQDDLDELPSGDSTQASERELKMAQQLIDSLSADFEPDKYTDTYRERLLELIEQKAKGEQIVVPPESDKPSPVVDLMAALEASLAAAREGRPLHSTASAGAAEADSAGAAPTETTAKAKAAKAKKATKTSGSRGKKAS